MFPLLVDRQEGRERSTDVTEKHPLIASHAHLTGDHTHPDQGWNLQPFIYRALLQPTEPYRPGYAFFKSTLFRKHCKGRWAHELLMREVVGVGVLQLPSEEVPLLVIPLPLGASASKIGTSL